MCVLFSRSKLNIFNLYYIYSSFRYNFHATVCLLSKFFQHFLEGENLYELDLNNYNNLEGNVFSHVGSLSSNWKGTCDLLETITYFKNNYTNNLSLLNSTLETSVCSLDSICHKTTLNYFQATSQLIEELNNVSTISSTRPSGSTTTLIPQFELEFQNFSDLNTLGGLIYNNYVNNLLVDMIGMEILQTYGKEYIDSYGLVNELNNEYNNIMNFDKTVASAASIIITNYIMDKKLILNFFQFMFIFIFTGYLGTLTCVFIFLIIYQCEKYRCLYFFLIGFINLFMIFAIWAIVLGALFQGIRHFVRESPRVMKFLFTEDYILNGNTDSYPPKFGMRDQTQIDFFTSCLNGDGDLFSNFVNKDRLNTILTRTKDILDLSYDIYDDINIDIQNSNLVSNTYSNYKNNSYIYSSIIKLEEMRNNLYLTSEGFGNDDIRYIINYIRTNLDSSTCGMTFEYYVIKKSDCPRYSIVLTEITNTIENIYHCYVIQDLASTTKAQYTNTSCDNNYINNAITFIKKINSILTTRINNLKSLQNNYVLTYNNMRAELSQINGTLTQITNLLNDEINNNYPKANCSSLKFDLIDFSDFMHDKIGYKLKIVIIFSCLAGMFGYFALYAILLLLNKINENNIGFRDNNNSYYPYSKYSRIKEYEPPSKIRTIKPIHSSKNKTDDERFNYDNKNKFIGSGINNSNIKRNLTKEKNKKINNSNNNIKGDVIYNNVRKIEMKSFDNKNN